MHRNFFGAQIRSFVTQLKAPACMKDFGPELEDFRAVFIRFAVLLQPIPADFTIVPSLTAGRHTGLKRPTS